MSAAWRNLPGKFRIVEKPGQLPRWEFPGRKISVRNPFPKREASANSPWKKTPDIEMSPLDVVVKLPKRRPWEKSWHPKPIGNRKYDLTTRIAERRAQDVARRQADRARARERANAETRQRQSRTERDRQRAQKNRGIVADASKNVLGRQAASMLKYHRNFGRKWMAERGPFGMTMTMYPVAKYAGKALGKVMEAGGYAIGALGMPATSNVGFGLSYKIKKGVKAIEHYESALRQKMNPADAPKVIVTKDAAKPDTSLKPVGNYQVLVKGTVAMSVQDRVVSEIAKSFADRLEEQQRANPGLSRAKVSTQAHMLVQEMDLPDIARKHGIRPHNFVIEPLSGVTGQRGGQVRYDIGLFGRRAALIELKSSAYSSKRTRWQLFAHHFGVGHRTATYGKPGDYYLINADKREIRKWTGNEILRYVLPRRGASPRAR